MSNRFAFVSGAVLIVISMLFVLVFEDTSSGPGAFAIIPLILGTYLMVKNSPHHQRSSDDFKSTL